MNKSNGAIGIFDSGVGGLSALVELRRLLPRADFVYFGDTGRVPYGTRSAETVCKYAGQDMRFLLSRGVSAVLVACGTVSAVALPSLKKTFSIPITGVIEEAVKAAVNTSKNKKIAVIGTEATVSSGVFEKKIKELLPEAQIVCRACPLFVPLVENGFIERDNPALVYAAKRYLSPVAESGADTLILGCTHYPLISKTVADLLPGVTLVNPAYLAAASFAKEYLSLEGSGKTEYFVSDAPERFEATAEMFMGRGEALGAKKIDIESY